MNRYATNGADHAQAIMVRTLPAHPPSARAQPGDERRLLKLPHMSQPFGLGRPCGSGQAPLARPSSSRGRAEDRPADETSLVVSEERPLGWPADHDNPPTVRLRGTAAHTHLRLRSRFRHEKGWHGVGTSWEDASPGSARPGQNCDRTWATPGQASVASSAFEPLAGSPRHGVLRVGGPRAPP